MADSAQSARRPSSSSNSQPPAPETTKMNGTTSKPSNAVNKTAQQSTVSAPPEQSNADKKKQAKADKAARRAKQKAEVPGGMTQEGNKSSDAVNDSATRSVQPQEPVSKGSGDSSKSTKQHETQDGKVQHKRAGSITTSKPDSKAMSVRQRRPSQNQGSTEKESKLLASKQVGIFAHLYSQPRRHSIEGVSKDIHPAVLALGLQLSNYVICGSHARCVAMLSALKAVIQSYTTPHGTSLPRHLSSHALSPQLSHIKACRAFSVSQSNAIRWLKNFIANIDPGASEVAAKQDITSAIDTFIRERFTVADQVIADAAAARIVDGDVVMTFAKSAVVQQVLLAAARRGVKFSVVVVDSRPLLEGKNLAHALADVAGVDVTYCLTPALAHAVRGVTKCFLGTHAVLGNGNVYSRVGTALVAMSAKEHRIPVHVCAESVKFTERVALDGIIMNELAPEEDLINAADDGQGLPLSSLKEWQDMENLQLLNVMFDVTPAELVSVIITELGSFPPTSAPVVQRISAG